MTPSSPRSRPRRATSPLSVRVAHALLGAVAAVVWLVLPWVATHSATPASVPGERPAASGAVAQREGEDTSTGDLVLPLVVAGAVVVVAGFGYVRRTRRARSRTTPGGKPAGPAGGSGPPLEELDERARALLAEADDWVRTSREELAFAQDRSGAQAVAPFARALREAEAELAAAFRMRQQYDEGVPGDETGRRQALAGILGRCLEAGRRLDAAADGFDELRGLERDPGPALAVAQARFHALTARMGPARALLADLAARHAASATDPVVGSAEQAEDRLLFATTHLNRAYQATDLGDRPRAAAQLRAAEAAVAQAEAFVDGVERLAAELRAAGELVGPVLTGAEAELALVRGALPPPGTGERPADAGTGAMAGAAPDAVPDTARPVRRPGLPQIPLGELHSRALHADAVLASVRQELTAGRPYDPLAVLRRVVGAVAPLATRHAGVLPAAAGLLARSSTAVAAGFVTTHRGAVGGTARTRLAEAARLLPSEALADQLRADALALDARERAERDVRAHGSTYAGAAGSVSGVAGAVVGGILLAAASDDDPAGPVASFGGPTSRGRRGAP
ncbi:hypothetical protein AB0K80_05890 [Streptomyces sp. NPDC052682]|uniref:hypothetical protein n=1 Tax=Streptomyces sp. NPDC052682 TaxID=3154954 RepID=UPI0034264F3C